MQKSYIHTQYYSNWQNILELQTRVKILDVIERILSPEFKCRVVDNIY